MARPSNWRTPIQHCAGPQQTVGIMPKTRILAGGPREEHPEPRRSRGGPWGKQSVSHRVGSPALGCVDVALTSTCTTGSWPGQPGAEPTRSSPDTQERGYEACAHALHSMNTAPSDSASKDPGKPSSAQQERRPRPGQHKAAVGPSGTGPQAYSEDTRMSLKQGNSTPQQRNVRSQEPPPPWKF